MEEERGQAVKVAGREETAETGRMWRRGVGVKEGG